MMPSDADLAIFTNSWDGTLAGHLGTIPKMIQESAEFVGVSIFTGSGP